MTAAVIPIVRASPTREPAAADAGPRTRAHRVEPPARVWTVAAAMRTPHFWLLFAVYLLTGLGSFLVSLHQLAWAIGVGFDPLYAASVRGTRSRACREAWPARSCCSASWTRSTTARSGSGSWTASSSPTSRSGP